MTHYSVYIRSIREALQAKNINVQDVITDLLTMTAIDHDDPEKRYMLLSDNQTELEDATTFNRVFNLLTRKYASFLNYEILQFIVNSYELDDGKEEFKYQEHLKAYVTKHKISEFSQVYPLPRIPPPPDSKKLALKIDIETTARLAKLQDLHTAIAKIFKIHSATLQLYDIKDGCLVITFTIPTSVANIVFKKSTTLSKEQKEKLEDLSILWIECNGCIVDFTAKSKHENANTEDSHTTSKPR